MKEDCNIYLVMQVVSGTYDLRKKHYISFVEEVTGVFDTLEKAGDACVDDSQYIMPLILNKAAGLDRVEVAIIDHKGKVVLPTVADGRGAGK